MSNILLICPMADLQSGLYIHDDLIELGHNVAYYDQREVMKDKGLQGMNLDLINVAIDLKPDAILIIKGLEILPNTLDKLKEICPKIIGWIFDVTIGGKYVKDVPEYIELIKKFDTFYTIDAETVPDLKALGVNAEFMSEGCNINYHSEQVINSIQKRKYGDEVVFLGSVGSIHPNREKILKRIYEEGIPLKIYGEVLYPENTEPEFVKECHTGFGAINDKHSIICQSSKIVIGIDGWPDHKYSWSARMYRVMCAGGFYLTTYTKGLEDYFDIGKELETYKDEDELIVKILYYLQHDSEREEIAKKGQEKVKNLHKFANRLALMF